VIGGLLALLVVGLLVLVSCGVPGAGEPDEDDLFAEIGEPDARATAACELYTPLAGDVRSGALTGPKQFRALQDVYNEARLSESENFAFLVQAVLNAAITGDEQVRNERMDRLDEVCAGD
jgi:hypothetical protein